MDNIKKDVLLSKYSTFKIGGYTSYFYEVENVKELQKIIEKCRKEKIEYQILGNGSNILFNDQTFLGIVIHFGKNFSCIKKRGNTFTCLAGTSLSTFVFETIKKGYQGLEHLVGIPASLGGAIYGNAGSCGTSISDNLVSVKCLKNNKIVKYKKKDLSFSYRDSFFKNNPHLIILEATFKLKKGNKEKLINVVKEELKRRKEKQSTFPNIGCIFKNINGESAGKIIELCGLKGKSVGGVRISEKHCNIIENFNQGTSKDVLDLINLIKNEVYKQTGYSLEEEIIIW